MGKFKKPFLFALALFPIAAVGCYFAARMSVSLMEPSLLEEAVGQTGSRELLIALSTIQPVMLTLLCGFFGCILSEKIGLMRPFQWEKPPLFRTWIASLIGGALLSLDAWTFGKWIPQVGLSYESAGAFDAVTWIASILYGGIIEEVMMRLFLMSLLAWAGWKLFFRNEKAVPVPVLAGANIIAAALFAAGHLPTTAMSFGSLTPLLVFRCFLMNGAFGLLFGRLYRKYGIQYAMLSHMLFHIVSRTIWMIAF